MSRHKQLLAARAEGSRHLPELLAEHYTMRLDSECNLKIEHLSDYQHGLQGDLYLHTSWEKPRFAYLCNRGLLNTDEKDRRQPSVIASRKDIGDALERTDTADSSIGKAPIILLRIGFQVRPVLRDEPGEIFDCSWGTRLPGPPRSI
jgi:hypothetical protein